MTRARPHSAVTATRSGEAGVPSVRAKSIDTTFFPGVRFLAVMDSASQRRGPRRDDKQRALRSRVTHHTVTSSTIEEQLLKRFDGVVERAVHFGGWEPLR